MKVQRNSPCPCGSGKKYKRCCMLKNNIIHPFELFKQSRKAFSDKYCLFPSTEGDPCEGNIIKAHTISRYLLKKISKNSHVYTVPKAFKVFRHLLNQSTFSLELSGINNVSTFTGFCAYHDNKIFMPIENQEIKINDECVFLLSYRSLCHELFNKVAQTQSHDIFFNANTTNQPRLVKEFLNDCNKGFKAAIEDAMNAKSIMDKMLVSGSYGGIRYRAYELNAIPSVAASFCRVPSYDFQGRDICDKRLTDAHDRLPLISFQMIPYKRTGIVIVSWVQEDEMIDRYIESLDAIDKNDLPDALLKYVFFGSETFAINPKWWGSRDRNEKKYIKELILSNVSPNRLKPMPQFYQDDKIVDWEVVDVIKK